MSDESMRAELDALKAQVAALEDGLGNTDGLVQRLVTEIMPRMTASVQDGLQRNRATTDGQLRAIAAQIQRGLDDIRRQLKDGEDWKR